MSVSSCVRCDSTCSLGGGGFNFKAQRHLLQTGMESQEVRGDQAGEGVPTWSQEILVSSAGSGKMESGAAKEGKAGR